MSMLASVALSVAVIQVKARMPELASALAAGLLGVFLVCAAGFVQIEAIHNAAHDARHSAGFPCH